MHSVMQTAKAFDPESVRHKMVALEKKVTTFGQPVIDYFSYYNLIFNNVSHYFGSFTSAGTILAGHLWLPQNPTALAIVVHGYYDHTGILKNAISYLISKNFAVASFDLPGHGLSYGKRSSIKDFSQYGESVHDFINTVKSYNLSLPITILGHSTGCAALVEYRHNYPKSTISKAIFVAPLVRSVYWNASKIAYFGALRYIRNTPRLFRNSSHDSTFLNWYHDEPLQEKTFPTEWAGALFRWNSRLKNYPHDTLTLHIIQGTHDETIDWKSSLATLKTMYFNSSVNFIPEAKHHIINEIPNLREQFFSILDTILH